MVASAQVTPQPRARGRLVDGWMRGEVYGDLNPQAQVTGLHAVGLVRRVEDPATCLRRPSPELCERLLDGASLKS